ncbi:hypothetical protein V2J09_004821 [Rumex salicifolius]
MEENCLMGHTSQPPVFSPLTGQHSSQFEKDVYSLLQGPTPADLSPAPAACRFMGLLGNHHSFESLSSVLDGMSHQITSPTPSITTANTTKISTMCCSSGIPEASEVSNQYPATPNSSSISSASNDDRRLVKEEEEHEDQDPKNKTCTKQPLKPKKTSQKKKQREARIAFMTKSEVDHLEDGYRWRKYGQKAVKNSSFPRSYYRCTSSACNVKKRVERCFHDPSIVITTYEGQHIHPSPIMAHGRLGFPTGFSAAGGATLQPQMITTNDPRSFSNYFPHDNNYVNGFLPTMNSSNQSMSTTPPLESSFVLGRRICNGDSLPRDNGLLQDIVPSNVYQDGQ